MTARKALDTANAAEPGERLRRYETICGPRRFVQGFSGDLYRMPHASRVDEAHHAQPNRHRRRA